MKTNNITHHAFYRLILAIDSVFCALAVSMILFAIYQVINSL